MNLVRQNILEILKESSGATVAELAERLDMAPVSVRHHLDILQGDNLICVEGLARTGAVGRPQQMYALTDDANSYFPDNFAALASGLLRQLRDVLPPERFESALRSMARDFAAPAGIGRGEEAPLSEERLNEIVHFLNERGYLGSLGAARDCGLCRGRAQRRERLSPCTSATAPTQTSPSTTMSSASWTRRSWTNWSAATVNVCSRWRQMSHAVPTASCLSETETAAVQAADRVQG